MRRTFNRNPKRSLISSIAVVLGAVVVLGVMGGCGDSEVAQANNSAAGASGQGGAGGAGGANAGTGGTALNPCFDKFLLPEDLPGEGWSETGRIVPSIWAGNEGVVVPWQISKKSDLITNPISVQSGHNWIIISALSGINGDSSIPHDMIPSAVGVSAGAYYGTTVGSSTLTAFLTNWGLDPEKYADGYLYIVDNGETKEVGLDPMGTLIGAVHVAWDGEAFVVHGYGGLPELADVPGYPLWMMRVSESGDVIQDWTLFGSTPSVGYGDLGFKVSTDANSGYTYVFDAAGGAYLNGHDRQGNPLARVQNYHAVDLLEGLSAYASQPAIASDEQGAWIGFNYDQEFRVVRVDRNGDAVSDILAGKILEDDARGWFSGYALISHSPTEAVLVASSGARLYTYPVTREAIGTPNIVYEVTKFHKAPAGFTYPALVTAMGMSGVSAAGHDYVAFTTASEQSASVLRVLQVDPGCTYEAWPPEAPKAP